MEGAEMNAESIAKALGGRRVGSTWMGRCPAHDHRWLSGTATATYWLTAMRDANNGTFSRHCGRGLWPETASMEIPNIESRTVTRNGTIVARYDYTDECGALLYQVLRKEPKAFVQRYADGRGGWIWRKHRHQVLYRLPELMEAAIVFIVEGEKDVETLRSHGFVATCEAGGAKVPWLPQFTECLSGREVILIPDRDRPGRERVVRIARALFGHVAKLIILDLEHEGKDVTDWFASGHSELEFIALAEGVAVTTR
jgi:5S rRNA maturation endonuclease (ribonuclease M5)